MDDSSDYIWSFFLKVKFNLADNMIDFIKNLKNKSNLKVQYLCCDNAGENNAIKKACKLEGQGVEFEYTTPGMPQ